MILAYNCFRQEIEAKREGSTMSQIDTLKLEDNEALIDEDMPWNHPSWQEWLRGVNLDELHRNLFVRHYELKISIKGAYPAIWRSLVVPCDFSVEELHEAIMVLFGWRGRRAYYFKRGRQDKYYENPALIHGRTFPEGEEHLSAADCLVKDLLPTRNSRAVYVYGSRTPWELSIEVLKATSITSSPKERDYPFKPVCTGGRFANVPEELGGAEGLRRYRAEADEAGQSWFDMDAVNVVFVKNALERLDEEEIPEDPDELRNAYFSVLAKCIATEVRLMLTDEEAFEQRVSHAGSAIEES